MDDVVIVGAGLSGLATAAFVRHLRPEWSVRVVEAGPRAGGVISTLRESGYLAEGGPHGFLDNRAESRRLVRLAGLEKDTVRAPLGRFHRYICMAGSLRALPQSPGEALRTPLLSWKAKLRLAADLWTRPVQGEPSAAEWAARRFGPAVLPLVDAVFTGTYAGDMHRLSMDAVMPGLRALEKEHGSVLRGLLARRREKKAGKRDRARRRSLPAMTSFTQGMEALPRALAGQLGEALVLGHRALAVEQGGGGWRLRCEHDDFVCRRLVLALPVNAAFPLLATLPGIPAPPVMHLPESHIATVVLGFGPHADVPPGFGYLAPEREQRFCLGAMFSSRMFPQRTPERGVLVEALVGGRRHPERLELDDQELVRRAYEDLAQLIFLPEPPVFTAVLRARGGIPQLERGSAGLPAWRREVEERLPGLGLTGFGWGGIGINDMVKGAWRVAQAMTGNGPEVQDGNAPRPIYF